MYIQTKYTSLLSVYFLATQKYTLHKSSELLLHSKYTWNYTSKKLKSGTNKILVVLKYQHLKVY